MGPKKNTVSVTELKANCSAILDRIEKGAGPITVTRRGRPVAVLAPTVRSSRGMWSGKIRILGDIVNTDTAELWHVVSEE